MVKKSIARVFGASYEYSPQILKINHVQFFKKT